MKYIFLLSVASFFILTTVSASESENERDFESLLQNASDIATKKSLNIEYMPSVVTIVDAQTYMNAGVQNVGEALGMLPGIQVQLSPMGYPMTTVRGFKNPNAYLSDKIKILIDGVAINNEVSGSSNFYMDFPMQLVERIEVLRGPNSTLYGAGAFYGTVNIITKLGSSKQENQVYLGGGSYGYTTAGANIYNISNDWKIFADGYYQKNSKSLPVEGSSVGTDEAMKDLSLGFRAVNGGFEFLTRFKQNGSGNFYSFEGEMDPMPAQPKEHKNSYFLSQLSYKIDINDYKLETKANFSHRELNEGANIKDAVGIAANFAAVGVPNMQDGFFFQEKQKEQNLEAEAILTLPKIESNDILLGVGARHVKVTRDDYYNSVENAITQNLNTILASPNYDHFRYREENEPAFWANPTTSFLKGDLSRTITYSYLQDLISLNQDVDLILGLRVDDYSDFGTKISKRAAVVYRATDETVFKLLYGSAFRAPTLTEAYANGHINYRAGDENIKAEETDTYEAVVIYSPNFYNKFSLNLFYSELTNVIDLEEYQATIPGYQNYKDRISKGAEFEYSFNVKQVHTLYFNATYVDTDYTIPPEEDSVSVNQSMPDISKIMFKAMYIYSPTNKLSLGSTWHYYSATTRTQLQWVDIDSGVQQVHIFDETLTYRFSPSSEARVGVKNIFNADVRQPSYYYNTEGGIKREGTNYFVNYVQKF
ncbi:MAG: TonB-dependent receptor [Campylobacterales bacterium]|nr:TonB-dependent receptor [Campylobacterales bacterium]